MPTAGNAAANTVDLLDLTGANVSPDPLPSGFQARGIVALVFSTIAGLLGVAVIAWYGLGEMTNIEKEKQIGHVQEIAKERGVVSRTTTEIGTTASNVGRDRIETAR